MISNFVSHSHQRNRIRPDIGYKTIFIAAIIAMPFIIFLAPIPGYLIFNQSSIFSKVIGILSFSSISLIEINHFLSNWKRKEVLYFSYNYGKSRTTLYFIVTFFSQSMISHFMIFSPYFINEGLKFSIINIFLSYLMISILVKLSIRNIIYEYRWNQIFKSSPLKILLIYYSPELLPRFIVIGILSIISFWMKKSEITDVYYLLYILFFSCINGMLCISIVNISRRNLLQYRNFLLQVSNELLGRHIFYHRVFSILLFLIFTVLIQIR